MPLRLKIKKELTARSDRVKSVDIFPSENPWVLAALYSGNIYIWDYSTNTMVKSFETGNNPVRCAKFIVRKQWIVAGTDDMKMRVFNYNTMDKVKEWDAHTDYIRFIEVHPNRSFILSSSDDMSIKLWDWDRNFDCVQIFEGHSHYVMMVKINPKDTNTFASASLDKTIKVWGLTAGTPHFSLDGPGAHEKGVNCIDYYPGGDKPYLVSGADDRTVKIWDYQTKACLQTLEGHSHNVSSACFHPRLPVIISSSEDGTVRLWHSTTYRPETTLNYGLDRAWAVACAKDSNKIAIGYDEGTIVLKLGNEKPVASLDPNSGKLVWAINHDIQTVSLKGISKSSDVELVDGERISLNTRELGACEVYPQQLSHNCNGSFIVICGDGEYIIYTSQALRNKAFGSALEFVWSSLASGDYAIRESISRVKIFKNFKESKQVSLPVSSADGLFGGHCLAVRGPDCVVFFDWEEGSFIRKIDVVPLALYWNETGDTVIIACIDTFYVLHYNKEAVDAALAIGQVNVEEGVNGSFELVTTVNERIHTGQWVGECFLYTNNNRKLNYIVGGEIMTLCHLTTPSYLLGFVPKEDRVFVIDKSYNVVSYKLLLSVLSYQTAVVRKDFISANALLPLIPQSEHSAVARFLESQGFKEEALSVTTDPEHKFELAVDLKKLDVAHKVMLEINSSSDSSEESIDFQSKWRRLGDLALSHGKISLAELCAKKSNDLSGLLLLYSCAGNKEELVQLAGQAKENGRLNVAFIAYFLTGGLEEALELLIYANRICEAAFFARTYLPSQISRVLKLWKNDLKQINEKAAEALADPTEYANLFPDYETALMVEKMFLQNKDKFVPASLYPTAKHDLELNLIELVKSQLALQAAAQATAQATAQADIVDQEVSGQVEVLSMQDPEPEVQEVKVPSTPASPVRSAPHSPVKVVHEPSPVHSPKESPIVPPTEVTPVQSAPSSPVKSTSTPVHPSASSIHVEDDEDLGLDDEDLDCADDDNRDALENDDFDEEEDW